MGVERRRRASVISLSLFSWKGFLETEGQPWGPHPFRGPVVTWHPQQSHYMV